MSIEIISNVIYSILVVLIEHGLTTHAWTDNASAVCVRDSVMLSVPVY